MKFGKASGRSIAAVVQLAGFVVDGGGQEMLSVDDRKGYYQIVRDHDRQSRNEVDITVGGK